MSKDSLLELINKCVDLCKEEQNSGYVGEATRFQVEEVILPDMEQIRQCIISGNIPKDRHVTSFWTAFKCWDWDMFNATELYLTLQKLDAAYRAYQVNE